MKEQLIRFLKTGAAWEKMETDVPGVFVVKTAGPKANPEAGKLMIEINPVDESGKPKKFKGLMLSDKESFTAFLETMQDDRIHKILSALEEITPAASARSAGKQMAKLKMD
jgi:hypothetical protein